MADFRSGHFVPFFSALLRAELERALAFVRDLHVELIMLAPTPQPLTGEPDALATVADVDVIVSWGFRHVVRFDKIRAFNGQWSRRGRRVLRTGSTPRRARRCSLTRRWAANSARRRG